MVSTQAIFDTVVNHLLTQNAKSKPGKVCLYRGPKGMRCAVGAVLPDEIYRPELENGDVDTLIDRLAMSHGDDCITVREMRRDVLLLHALQNVHDNISVRNWPGALRATAVNFNLKYNGAR